MELPATDAVTLYSVYVYPVFIILLAVAHHRQVRIFPDFSLIAFKIPDFSMFCRLVAILKMANAEQPNMKKVC